MRYGAIRGIIEAGNCVYCGRHIDDGGHIFLCEECRRKEEERECLHEGLKEAGTGMVKPGRSTMGKGQGESRQAGKSDKGFSE